MSESKKISLPISGSTSVEANHSSEAGAQGGDIQAEIAKINSDNPIVLYMKGTPDQPMCGFSASASAILSSYGKPYTAVNVLADPEIRQGIKVYGNWPTIPQLYVGGELMGGSDIMRQMHESGELLSVIESALTKDD